MSNVILTAINYAFIKTLGKGVWQYAPTSFLEMSNVILTAINYAFIKTLGKGVWQYAPTSFLEMSNVILTAGKDLAGFFTCGTRREPCCENDMIEFPA